VRVGDGREKVEREYFRESEIVGKARGSGRGREGGWECVTNLESRGWERRESEGGWECVCKRDRVGDGRECESVRESMW